jgi:hypothetical protein
MSQPSYLSPKKAAALTKSTGVFLPGVARLLLIVGGTFQKLARIVAAAGADLVLYLDVPNEVEATRPREGVISITLACGETLGTLASAGCPGDLKDFFANRPGVNLSLGLGQLRAVGDLAVRKRLADPAFERFLVEEVFDRLFVKHNGSIEQAILTVASSDAGGTGGPAGLPVASALAQILLERTDAAVHVQVLRVGSLSYFGLGDRVHTNAAATLAEDVSYVLSARRHPREVRSLLLCELPMVGAHKDQRDDYVVQLCQALRASEVLTDLNRSAPNNAFDTPFGAISVLRPSWWRGIEDRQIAAEVAAYYLPRLDRIRRTGPFPGVLKGVQVVLKEGQKKAPSVDDLLATVRSCRAQPKDFFATCTQPSASCTGTVLATARNGTVVNVTTKLRLCFSTPCSTEAEFTTRIGTLRAMEAAVASEHQQRTARIGVLQRDRLATHVELKKALKLVYPRGPADWVRTALANPGAKVTAFRNAMNRVREVADELVQREAEAQALDDARRQLDAEIKRERERLQGVSSVLAPFRPTEETPGQNHLVEVTDLDAVLNELLESNPGTDPEEVLRLLGSCARRVTLAGLAEITQAKEARAESIARQLAHGAPATQAPVWGGRKPLARGDVITVLPPVEDEVKEDIRKILANLDGHMVLASSDTGQGGVNALRLEVFRPRSLEEIFTPFIRKNLTIAVEGGRVYFPNGVDFLEQLGLLSTASAPEPASGNGVHPRSN